MAMPAASPVRDVVPEVSARTDGGIASTLEQDLQSATDDFDRGDYVELSDEQIERCIATGESPWPDEFRG
jgi:hypothetical protein